MLTVNLSFMKLATSLIDGPHTLIIDKCGRCGPIDELNEEHRDDSVPHSWKCCNICKPLTDKEIAIILDFSQI